MKVLDINDLITKCNHGTGDSDRHLLTLFSVAISSRAKVIVELGVRSGTTTIPLLKAAKINNAEVHSVDILDKPNNIPKEYDDIWTFYKKNSIEFLQDWPKDKKIDFVYIDNWHSYDHVKKELELLDELVSPSTVILLHDLMYGDTCPFYHVDLTIKDGQWGNGGPYRAVAELNPQFWEFSTLPWNNGLTFLRKKYSSKYWRY
jgi:hypothetical protein